MFARGTIGDIVFARGTIGDSGFPQHSFQHKGCVYVPMENTEKKLTLDEAMDVAIETGAEEVEETHDDDGNRVLKVVSHQFITLLSFLLNSTFCSCHFIIIL